MSHLKQEVQFCVSLKYSHHDCVSYLGHIRNHKTYILRKYVYKHKFGRANPLSAPHEHGIKITVRKREKGGEEMCHKSKATTVIGQYIRHT